MSSTNTEHDSSLMESLDFDPTCSITIYDLETREPKETCNAKAKWIGTYYSHGEHRVVTNFLCTEHKAFVIRKTSFYIGCGTCDKTQDKLERIEKL